MLCRSVLFIAAKVRSKNFGCISLPIHRFVRCSQLVTTGDSSGHPSISLNESDGIKKVFLRFLAPSVSFVRANLVLLHCIPEKGSLAVRGFSTTARLSRERFQERAFVCPYDGVMFRTPQQLRLHLRKHAGEKLFRCDLNSLPFKGKAALRLHQENVHWNRYVCPYDSRSFSSAVAFKCHMDFYHNRENMQILLRSDQTSTDTSDATGENNGDDLTMPFDCADVTFLVEDKRIYYNRGMLAMHSPHFKRLFYGANACHDKELRLKDKKFDDAHVMLKLPKASAEDTEQLISDENVEDLLKLAEEYQLRHVTAECEIFLLLNWKFDKSKIVKVLKLSAQMKLPNLAKAFIPLAACRPLAEIDRSIDKLSTELFCAIIHAALVKTKACGYNPPMVYGSRYDYAKHEYVPDNDDPDPVIEQMLKRNQQNF